MSEPSEPEPERTDPERTDPEHDHRRQTSVDEATLESLLAEYAIGRDQQSSKAEVMVHCTFPRYPQITVRGPLEHHSRGPQTNSPVDDAAVWTGNMHPNYRPIGNC